MARRIVVQLRRPEARKLQRQARKTKDAALRVRLQTVLLYAQGHGGPTIASMLGIDPSTPARIARRFLKEGAEGLIDGRTSNGTPKVDEDLLQALTELVSGSPEDHGERRPTWTREQLSRTLRRHTGVCVSVTTVARMLARLGARWGMARPTVACPWSRQRKTRVIRRILRRIAARADDELAYYEDEVDIHLNPKIGRDWMLCGQQKTILTPGKNVKRYIAGALAVDGTEIVFVEAEDKRADLFLALLAKLRRTHSAARRIHLILDNYSIHSSRQVQVYLQHAGKGFVLHFLPPYCPDHNRIERLWRDLHANVTRNHRCRSIQELMRNVRDYLHREDRRRRRQEPQAPRPPASRLTAA